MMYRYTLERICGDVLFSTKTVLWVMLNPSTADTTLDDPTIRKCIGFTKRWGFRRLVVANLFAWRATKPRDLWQMKYLGHDIVGPENDETIRALDREADMVVVAWGRLPRDAEPRRDEVLRLLDHRRELYAVDRNADGGPSHPLMVAYAAPLIWRHREAA